MVAVVAVVVVDAEIGGVSDAAVTVALPDVADVAAAVAVGSKGVVAVAEVVALADAGAVA